MFILCTVTTGKIKFGMTLYAFNINLGLGGELTLTDGGVYIAVTKPGLDALLPALYLSLAQSEILLVLQNVN